MKRRVILMSLLAIALVIAIIAVWLFGKSNQADVTVVRAANDSYNTFVKSADSPTTAQVHDAKTAFQTVANHEFSGHLGKKYLDVADTVKQRAGTVQRQLEHTDRLDEQDYRNSLARAVNDYAASVETLNKEISSSNIWTIVWYVLAAAVLMIFAATRRGWQPKD